MDRRSFLKTAGGFAAYSLVNPLLLPRTLRRGDDAFLDGLSEHSFRYFWEQSDPHTGLTPDRTAANPQLIRHNNAGSIAATGFGLSALCIGASRDWIDQEDARTRVRNSLDFFANHAPHERGWFYHLMDIRSGQRCGYSSTGRWKSEVSSVDSSLLMGGVLTARQYFRDDDEIGRLAEKIYQRMDFRWMLNGHPTLLSQGWSPERGFIRYRWDTYCEMTLLYLLGIGSPTFSLGADSWYAWNRDENTYDGSSYVGKAPLFTHQFSHAFVDYRGRREARGSGKDWYENSVVATRAHRQFCVDLSRRFPGYSDRIWGVTSSDSANGYVAWGGPPILCGIDGTVVPCAAAGSLMFTPDICVPALRAMSDQFGHKVYGRYGFIDAFHPVNGWVGRDYVGIDVGISLLAAENLRSGNMWKWFMANPEIRQGLDRAGLHPDSSSSQPSYT